jgi:hypothetical protein
MLTGGVQEEWFSAHPYVHSRVLISVPVIRRGDHQYYDELPWEMKRHGGFDLREECADQYRPNINKIAGFLHFERRHGDPPIDFELSDWVDLYIAWCRALMPSAARLLLRPRPSDPVVRKRRWAFTDVIRVLRGQSKFRALANPYFPCAVSGQIVLPSPDGSEFSHGQDR